MVGPNEPIIKRYEKNPILTKHDVPYPVETVHNAGVVKHDGRYIMLFRSHCRNGRSIIGLAESEEGLSFRIRPEPFASYEEYGVEDPRICAMDGAVYRVGAALHDLKDPSRVLGVADDWILQPEAPWEVSGYVNNVVFCCGAVAEDDGTIKIYWGGADSVMCAGTALVEDLVNLCLSNPRSSLGI